jgi:hypothetical protein
MKLTEAQLMAASPVDLSPEQIVLRREILALRKLEMESELTAVAIEKHNDEKTERARKMQHRQADIQAERDRIEAEQNGCLHLTGGSGLGGFFSGDGSIYGSSTAVQILPDGSYVGICFRCQREWRLPKKRDVIEGRQTLAAYRKQEKEFHEMLRWKRTSFAPWNGEFCAASQFRIPRLEEEKRKDGSSSSCGRREAMKLSASKEK